MNSSLIEDSNITATLSKRIKESPYYEMCGDPFCEAERKIAFVTLDRTNEGFLSVDDLDAAVRGPERERKGGQRQLKKVNAHLSMLSRVASRKTIKAMMIKADLQGDGHLDFRDWSRAIVDRKYTEALRNFRLKMNSYQASFEAGMKSRRRRKSQGYYSQSPSRNTMPTVVPDDGRFGNAVLVVVYHICFLLERQDVKDNMQVFALDRGLGGPAERKSARRDSVPGGPDSGSRGRIRRVNDSTHRAKQQIIKQVRLFIDAAESHSDFDSDVECGTSSDGVRPEVLLIDRLVKDLMALKDLTEDTATPRPDGGRNAESSSESNRIDRLLSAWENEGSMIALHRYDIHEIEDEEPICQSLRP